MNLQLTHYQAPKSQ